MLAHTNVCTQIYACTDKYIEIYKNVYIYIYIYIYSAMFVHYGIPAFGKLQRKHITNFIHWLLSRSNSIIMSVVLSSVSLSSLIWGYWFKTLNTSK